MNMRLTRVSPVLLIVVGLGLLNACTTDRVVETPKPVVVLPIFVTPIPKPIPTILNIRTSASFGNIVVTETRNITTGQITRASTSQPATISFRAAPGSVSGSILGFRITSQKIGTGTELIDPNKPISRGGLNLYVQSGFSCIPAPAVTQSCSLEAGTPANGLESSALSLLSDNLEAYMVAKRSDATETMEITFLGIDENGKTFEIPVNGLSFVGQFKTVN